MSSIIPQVQDSSSLNLVSGNRMTSVINQELPFAPSDNVEPLPAHPHSSPAAIEANGFNILPGEIRNKIFGLALTADNAVIVMPCLSGKSFKPNVATALLCVCRQIYHEARGYLYTRNTVVIDNFGADLESISRLAVDNANRRPSFREVIFDVGDAQIDWEGYMKTGLFVNGLTRMRHEISVDHLRLEFHPFCFGGITKPEDFAAALGHLKVNKTMTMSGVDYLWEEGDMRAIPRSLKMNIQPITSVFIPRNNNLQYPRMGCFLSTYKLAKNAQEITSVVGGGLIDPGVTFAEWCDEHGL